LSRKTFSNIKVSLYPTFVVYLTTIYGRLSFFSYFRVTLRFYRQYPEWIIIFSKNVIGRFRFCFTKIRNVFHNSKSFFIFFFKCFPILLPEISCLVRFIPPSFITLYHCFSQLFYKDTKSFLYCQFFFINIISLKVQLDVLN